MMMYPTDVKRKVGKEALEGGHTKSMRVPFGMKRVVKSVPSTSLNRPICTKLGTNLGIALPGHGMTNSSYLPHQWSKPWLYALSNAISSSMTIPK